MSVTLPAGSYQPASIIALDAGGERGSAAFYGPILSAANYVAAGGLWDDLLEAWDPLFLGARIEDRYNDLTRYAVAKPTNGAAREISFQVWMRGVTSGSRWAINFPTVDLTLISYIDNIGARDAVDLSTTEVANFLSALTAFGVRNPFNYAETTGVIGAKIVRGQK